MAEPPTLLGSTYSESASRAVTSLCAPSGCESINYTEEQLQSLAARWSPELQEKTSRDWAELLKEVEASLDEDPASEKVQALATRWSELIEAFTGGDPGIEQSLRNLYAGQANWPDTFEKPFNNEAVAFISRRWLFATGKNQRKSAALLRRREENGRVAAYESEDCCCLRRLFQRWQDDLALRFAERIVVRRTLGSD
ncbi:MAG: TipAS antibiotic-recognition domain-containing protein [Blastocatellia bacterium]